MTGVRTAVPRNGRSRPAAVRAAASAAVLVCGALLLAGCGSSASSASASTASATGRGQGAGRGEFQAYRQCLEQHGYTPPARPSGRPQRSGRPSGFPGAFPNGRPHGGFGASGRPSGMPRGGGFLGNTADPAYRKAATACASLRPSFGPGRQGGSGDGNGNGNGGSAEQSALRAFADCMKSKGVAVSGSAANPLAGLSTADAKTAAALRTCRPLLPTPTPTPGSAAPSASPTA